MQKYNDKKSLLEDMNVFLGGNSLFRIKDKPPVPPSKIPSKDITSLGFVPKT